MKKLAVILHVYYENQIPAIRKHLSNLKKANIDYDLFVTTPHDTPTNIMQIQLTQHLKLTENKGYDIAPFIATLHSLNLDDYDYILKLHTKNESTSKYTYLNHHRLNNKIWSKIMWNALLGSPKQIKQNLEIMENVKTIGQIAPRYCLTSEPNTYTAHLKAINQELERLGYPATDKLTFAAGTMFLIRAKLLKPLLSYKITDFSPTDSTIHDGTLAHIIERLYGALTIAQGYQLAPINHRTYPIARGILTLKRFIVQKKQTKSGKTLIKFCKIPIWQS